MKGGGGANIQYCICDCAYLPILICWMRPQRRRDAMVGGDGGREHVRVVLNGNGPAALGSSDSSDIYDPYIYSYAIE